MVSLYVRDRRAAEVANTSPRTAHYILYYHFVFRTKFNRPILTAPIADRLLEVLLAVAQERGYVVFAAAAMPDHVHVVVSLKPTMNPADAMRFIKGRLSHDLHADFPDLGGGPVWADGYYVEAVGKKNVLQVLHYVARQDEHHLDGPA